MYSKKARFPKKIPGNKLQKKHFTKMQKHVGLASTKNQTRWDSHDNTFSDYHPYIDLSNHTHHNLPYLHITHIQSHTLHNTQHILLANYTLKTPLTHTTNYWSTFHNYSHIQHHQSMQLHGHTPHHKPLHLQANKSSTTISTCTIVVGT